MTNVVFFDIGNTLIGGKVWLPGAKECVHALREAKIRVGLISNTGRLMRDELQELLGDDFDFAMFEEGLTLLSSEVGIEKPSLSMFLLAIQHAKVSPWETMFVGESLSETLAAQAAGMHAARIVNPPADFEALVKFLTSQ